MFGKFFGKKVNSESERERFGYRLEVLERHVQRLDSQRSVKHIMCDQHRLYLNHVERVNDEKKIKFFDGDKRKMPKLIKPSFEGFMSWMDRNGSLSANLSNLSNLSSLSSLRAPVTSPLDTFIANL